MSSPHGPCVASESVVVLLIPVTLTAFHTFFTVGPGQQSKRLHSPYPRPHHAQQTVSSTLHIERRLVLPWIYGFSNAPSCRPRSSSRIMSTAHSLPKSLHLATPGAPAEQRWQPLGHPPQPHAACKPTLQRQCGHAGWSAPRSPPPAHSPLIHAPAATASAARCLRASVVAWVPRHVAERGGVSACC